jgi:adenylate cyclase
MLFFSTLISDPVTAQLFADIVGFTDRATVMSPHDVVTMLNDLFSRFDYLVDIYELNKVKTIGDCYMVTSIPSSDLEQDGCARVCRFALDLMKAVRAFNASGPQYGHIEMRCGIATGDIVAGVVGTKRFSFDMWGDAVNVAARMEQHGLPGQIQVTKEVVDHAGSEFTFESRGQLMVKGKGVMDTYLLRSAKNVELRRSVYQHWKPTPIAAMRSNSTLT